jgi:hypothetical protein
VPAAVERIFPKQHQLLKDFFQNSTSCSRNLSKTAPARPFNIPNRGFISISEVAHQPWLPWVEGPLFAVVAQPRLLWVGRAIFAVERLEAKWFTSQPWPLFVGAWASDPDENCANWLASANVPLSTISGLAVEKTNCRCYRRCRIVGCSSLDMMPVAVSGKCNARIKNKY